METPSVLKKVQRKSRKSCERGYGKHFADQSPTFPTHLEFVHAQLMHFCIIYTCVIFPGGGWTHTKQDLHFVMKSRSVCCILTFRIQNFNSSEHMHQLSQHTASSSFSFCSPQAKKGGGKGGEQKRSSHSHSRSRSRSRVGGGPKCHIFVQRNCSTSAAKLQRNVSKLSTKFQQQISKI